MWGAHIICAALHPCLRCPHLAIQEQCHAVVSVCADFLMHAKQQTCCRGERYFTAVHKAAKRVKATNILQLCTKVVVSKG